MIKVYCQVMSQLADLLIAQTGWRIEIPSFPELTSTGAWRRLPTGEMYGGYYTEQDIERVNRTAEALGITIVPEIELPGHCMATLASYPHLGCTGQHYEVPNEWGIFEDVYWYTFVLLHGISRLASLHICLTTKVLGMKMYSSFYTRYMTAY